MNLTKYCRLPDSPRLSIGCYFSYGSENFFKSMLRRSEGQFIHRLSTLGWGKERGQKSEVRGQRIRSEKERRRSSPCGTGAAPVELSAPSDLVYRTSLRSLMSLLRVLLSMLSRAPSTK